MENEMLEQNPLNDVLFIVLLYKNENFNTLAPYDIEIMGKKMWEWVALCGNGATIKTAPCTNESNIINLIKPFVGKEKYTFVFYSDTPLLTRETVLEIFENFKQSEQNVLKLERGYMFNSEYLKNCETVLADIDQRFNCDEFLQVNGYKELSEVTGILKYSIIGYHMDKGVYFIDPKSTFIDADVVIEKNVTIYPNNTIKGQSYIGENVVLEPNNTIINSIISKNVIVKNSYINSSAVSENVIVGPFEKIINKNS